MKVAYEVVKARRDELAQLLSEHQYLPLSEVCRRFSVSEATARRDLAELERSHAITRTWGGALGEYNQRFASFRDRQSRQPEAKSRIARAALALIKPGMTCYLDAGTTLFALAEAIAEGGPRPLTLVTNNLPVAERLAEVEGIEVNLLGGQLLRRQSTMLGDKTVTAARGWRCDLACFGAEGMDGRGLWNTSPEVVAVERAVARGATQTAFLVDAAKLGAQAPEFLLAWSQVDRLITDATPAALGLSRIALPKRALITC
jgi:DeoR/GlpR family transcriptional regulator of sugar metabolism